MEKFDSSDQSTVENSNNQYACACHTNDKREMEDDSNCSKCLKNDPQNLENAIYDAYIEQISKDLQQID